jgi:hypothetical protein
MSIFPWSENPPGARSSGIYCRGCSKPIWPLATDPVCWEDASGITVCVKARLEDVSTGQRPDYVHHAPMPDGLVGAPS